VKRAALLLLCCACAGTQVRREETPPPPREPISEEAPPPLDGIDAVLAAARAHLGKTTVRVNDRSFRYDCSGFVRGMFWAAGIDLMAAGGEDGDNGVPILFRYVEKHGQNHFRKLPQKGDLVYFDNTWDMNGNGKLDDPFTHVGLVESVGEDGTIQIIHRSNHGIVREPMNLVRPHDEKANAALRARGRRDPPGTQHLMAELFAGFGTISKR
jgi:cell wall-associated NlpC family hydrolase